MRRLPVVAFAALVLATIPAFFVIQHLKVSTPLIAGAPAPYPSALSPGQAGCGGFHRTTTISFYLLHRTDDVDVYVVDQTGTIVATLASGRHMRRGKRKPDGVFSWDGREDNGSLAPDGTYHVRVDLIHQGRMYEVPGPITVRTVPPRPVVTSVAPNLIPQGGTPVQIHYRGNESRGGTVRIYRTDLPGPPRLAKSFLTPWRGQTASWDGRIGPRPAPAGTYLVGLDVTDKACNTGHFPLVLPPAPGSTAHAGVTVRYLAAQPPLDPVPAGSRTTVYVDSRGRPYTWTLTRAGSRANPGRRPPSPGRRPPRTPARGTSGRAASGSPGRTRSAYAGRATGSTLVVRLPPGTAGLYQLSISSGSHRTAVPLIAYAAAAPGTVRVRTEGSRVLVVLPALTWQGLNPVDDDGDGIPNTLDAGGPVLLRRPLADGLPADLNGESALLAYLDKAHLTYDLTTDLGLIDATGPSLSAYRGVVVAGSERWLPASLATALHSYVDQGGRVLSLGIDSLRRGVSVGSTPRGQTATGPTPPAATDALGARPGALVTHNPNLVAVLHDGLGIFTGTSGAFPGFDVLQPIPSLVPPAQILSAAGTSAAQPSIVGYRLGRGIVVEIGLAQFDASLARSVDSQELVNRLWAVLSR
ncbi:MAG: N,N-dimethylformamidase beta subunit family domain-containing protein [Solirubrobacteraceae bacterium]